MFDPLRIKPKPLTSLSEQVKEAEEEGYLEGMAETISELYLNAPTHRYVDYLNEKLRVAQKRYDENRRERRNVQRKIAELEAEKKILEGCNFLVDGAIVLQACTKSRFGDLLGDLLGHRNYVISTVRSRYDAVHHAVRAPNMAQTFMVQHDWLRAFEKAQDFALGDFKLPYSLCAFEFQITGHAVIAICAQTGEQIDIVPFTEIGRTWVAGQAGKIGDEFEGDKITPLLIAQIRAISIALDAEVLTTQTNRAEYRRNAPKGQIQVAGYSLHTLKLRRANHAERLPGELVGTKRRLHFRRGHWRHYQTFKTWVRWTLVGNPDLGFVDKDYVL